MKTRVSLTACALFLACLLGPALPAASGASGADSLSLSLEEGVRLALEHNTRVLASRESLREAALGVSEARTAFFPQISASAGYTRLDTAPFSPGSVFAKAFGGSGLVPAAAIPERIPTGRVDNYAATVGVRQQLYAAGRIRNTYDIARLAEGAAHVELDLASSEIVFEATRAYLECLKVSMTERVAGETVNQLEAHVRDIEAKLEAGLAATNDVLKTKVYRADAELALLRARHARRLSEQGLCEILGLPLDTPLRLSTGVDSVAPPAADLDAAVGKALVRRAELRATDLRKLAIRKQTAIERNGYLPTLSFFADLSYLNPNREFLPEFYTAWRLGLVAQMNVFDWGRAVYRTRESRSRLRQLEIQEGGLRDAVALDVTRAHLTLLDAWSAVGAAREKLAQARENYRVTNERYSEGLATNTDLLDAEVLLAGAKTGYGTMLVDCVIAAADLERATGGPAEWRAGNGAPR